MSAVLKYEVTNQNKYKTVAAALKGEYGVSSGLLKELKTNGRLFLNGKPCKTVDLICSGDEVLADVSDLKKASSNIPPYETHLDIMYEDDFILVVNKPGGMDSQPCPSNRSTTLANAVMYHWMQSGEALNYHIVNRLDKETSGICVIAKNRFSHGVLSKQMKENQVKKKYLAIVHGVLQPKCGEIDLPISRKPKSVLMRHVSQDGRPAKTLYNVKEELQGGKWSLLDIQLITGRTHQIRVHFSHLGHPLLGDWLYGNGDNERDIIFRQALHARYLAFIHPYTKEFVEFEAELPAEMKSLINP